jgi:hypothetical protein
MRALKIFMIPMIVMTFLSCKKDHGVLGVDVQPSDDSLNNETTMFPVYAYTQTYDSIVSWNDRYKYLGSNNDPAIGKVDVGLYLNSCMTGGDPQFGDSVSLVSSEIILAVDNFKFCGDKNASLNYTVFPLDSSLSSSRIYFTSNTRLHNSTPLPGVFTASFSLSSSGQTILHIPVDAAYAATILKDKAAFKDNATFQLKYRGFYIKADAGSAQGVIYKVDMLDPISAFYLNYKATPNSTVTSTYKLSFNGTNAASFNTVKYDFNSAPTSLKNQLNGDSASGEQALFLKGLGVTRVKLQIPALKKQSDSVNIAVNRAELVLHLHPDYLSDGYTVPPSLALLPIGANGRDTFALDQLNVTDNLRYNGVYDDANQQYVFNIARQVQAIYKGQKGNYGFHLVVADPSKELVARRDNFYEHVVVAGTGNPDLKPKFTLSYIRFRKN